MIMIKHWYSWFCILQKLGPVIHGHMSWFTSELDLKKTEKEIYFALDQMKNIIFKSVGLHKFCFYFL